MTTHNLTGSSHSTPQPVHGGSNATTEDTVQLVTMLVGGQMFGIPIERVRDVFKIANLTPVPLAPQVVAGLYNLRGRIMTTLSLGGLFGLPETWRDKPECTALGIDWRGESFGLIIEAVGDVMTLPTAKREAIPTHLDVRWAQASRGVHQLADRLLVELDVDALLDRPLKAAA